MTSSHKSYLKGKDGGNSCTKSELHQTLAKPLSITPPTRRRLTPTRRWSALARYFWEGTQCILCVKHVKALLPDKATALQKMKLRTTPSAHGGICSLRVKRTTLEAAL